MGSTIKIEADQRTHGIRMSWVKDSFGEKLKAPIKLTLKKKFKFLPRLRRHSTSSSWQPAFMCLESNGIEQGAYSRLDIFTCPIDLKDGWGDKIEIEGWESYKNIKKMTFIEKNKNKIEITHKGDVWQGVKEITINPKNPIIEIIIE